MRPLAALVLLALTAGARGDAPASHTLDDASRAVAAANATVNATEGVPVQLPGLDNTTLRNHGIVRLACARGALTLASRAGVVVAGSGGEVTLVGDADHVRAALASVIYVADRVDTLAAADFVSLHTDCDAGAVVTCRGAAALEVYVAITGVNGAPRIAAPRSVDVAAFETTALGAAVSDDDSPFLDCLVSAERGSLTWAGAAATDGSLSLGNATAAEVNRILATLAYTAGHAASVFDLVKIRVADASDNTSAAEATIAVRVTGPGLDEALDGVSRPEPSMPLASRRLADAASPRSAQASLQSRLSLVRTLEDTPKSLNGTLYVEASWNTVALHLVHISFSNGALSMGPGFAAYTKRVGGGVDLQANASILSRALDALVYSPERDWHGVDYVFAEFDGQPYTVDLAVVVASVVDPVFYDCAKVPASTSGLERSLAGILKIRDVEASLLNVVITVAHGTLYCSEQAALSFGAHVVDAGESSVVLQGGAVRLNKALASQNFLLYTPAAGFAGDDALLVNGRTCAKLTVAAPADPAPFAKFAATTTVAVLEDSSQNACCGGALRGFPADIGVTISLKTLDGVLHAPEMGAFGKESFAWVSEGPTDLAFRATLVAAQAFLDGVHFSPRADFFGTARVAATLKIPNVHVSEWFDFSILVGKVPDAPRISAPENTVVANGKRNHVFDAGDVFVLDVDGTGAQLRLVIKVIASDASLALSTPSIDGVRLDAGPRTLKLYGDAPRLNAALRRLQVGLPSRPAAKDRTLASLSLSVTDLDSGLESTPAEVRLVAAESSSSVDVVTVGLANSRIHANQSTLNLHVFAGIDLQADASDALVLDVEVQVLSSRDSMVQFANITAFQSVDVARAPANATYLRFQGLVADARAALESVGVTSACGGLVTASLRVAPHGQPFAAAAKVLVVYKNDVLQAPPRLAVPADIEAYAAATFLTILRGLRVDDAGGCDADARLWNLTVSCKDDNVAGVGFFPRYSTTSILGTPASLTSAVEEGLWLELRDAKIAAARAYTVQLRLGAFPGSADDASTASVLIRVGAVATPDEKVTFRESVVSVDEDGSVDLSQVCVKEPGLPALLNIVADPPGLLRGVDSAGRISAASNLSDLAYTPPRDFFGVAHLVATSNGNVSDTLAIKVRPINDAPFVDCGFVKTHDELRARLNTSMVVKVAFGGSVSLKKCAVYDVDALDVVIVNVTSEGDSGAKQLAFLRGSAAVVSSRLGDVTVDGAFDTIVIQARDAAGANASFTLRLDVVDDDGAPLAFVKSTVEVLRLDEDSEVAVPFDILIRRDSNASVSVLLSLDHDADLIYDYEDQGASVAQDYRVLYSRAFTDGFLAVTIEGTAHGVREALGGVVYRPRKDFNGVAGYVTAALEASGTAAQVQVGVRIAPKADAPGISAADVDDYAWASTRSLVSMSVSDADDDLLEVLGQVDFGNVTVDWAVAVEHGVRVLADGADLKADAPFTCDSAAFAAGVRLAAGVRVSQKAKILNKALQAGLLRYASEAPAGGAALLSLAVRDAADCSATTVKISTVDDVKAALTVAPWTTAAVVLEDTPKTLAFSLVDPRTGRNVFYDARAMINVSLSAAHGFLTLPTDLTLLNFAGDGRVSLYATTLDAAAALARVVYTPDSDYYGERFPTRMPDFASPQTRRACAAAATEQKLAEGFETITIAVTTPRSGAVRTTTFGVSVLSVNDAPTLKGADGIGVAPKGWTALPGLVIDDVDGGVVEVNATVGDGEMALVSPAGVDFTTRANGATLIIRGSVALVQAALATLRFKPPAVLGQTALDVHVSDLGGCGLGAAPLEASISVVLTVATRLGLVYDERETRVTVLEDAFQALGPTALVLNATWLSDDGCRDASLPRRKVCDQALELDANVYGGNVSIFETAASLDFYQPARHYELHLRPNASDPYAGAQAAEWVVSTRARWRRGVVRLSVKVDAVASLATTQVRLSLTHRGRACAADLALGENGLAALMSVEGAFRDMDCVGPVVVEVEHFGAVEATASALARFRGEARFRITLLQNDAVDFKLVKAHVLECGAGRDDAQSAYVAHFCEVRFSQVQAATTLGETQFVTLRSNGTLDQGEFTLVFKGTHTQKGTQTRKLAYNATADDVREALEFAGAGVVVVNRTAFNDEVYPGKQPFYVDDCLCSGACAVGSKGANCTVDPRETTFAVLFATATGDLPDLVAHDSSGEDEVCKSCDAFSTAWFAPALAAHVGLATSRFLVGDLVAGTEELGGSFALRRPVWTDEPAYPGRTHVSTTGPISVRATTGDVQRALSQLYGGGMVTAVTKSAYTYQRAVEWRITFAPNLGDAVRGLEPVLDEFKGTNATVHAEILAQGEQRWPRDGGSLSLRASDAASSAVLQLSSSTDEEAVHRLVWAAVSTVSGVFDDGGAITVTRISSLKTSTGVSAAFAIRLAAGFGLRPSLVVDATALAVNLAVDLIEAPPPPTSWLVSLTADVEAQVEEVQVLSCSTKSSDDVVFRLGFRGLTSPVLTSKMAPNPTSLPACTPAVRGACKGDGSSLEETLVNWLAQLVEGDAVAVSVLGLTALCGEAGSVNITFKGIVGDVDLLDVVEMSVNGTLSVREATKGSAAFVAEVQRVEAFNLTLNGTSDADGWFALSFRGAQTAALSSQSTAGELESALAGLSTVGAVSVSRSPARGSARGSEADQALYAWSVTFGASRPTLGDLDLMEAVNCGNFLKECFLGVPASVRVQQVVKGHAPAYGDFRLSVDGVPATPYVRLDDVYGFTRTVSKALGSDVLELWDMAQHPLGQYGALWALEAVVGRVKVEARLKGSRPSLKVARLGPDLRARGSGLAVAKALNFTVFRPGRNDNVRTVGLSTVALTVRDASQYSERGWDFAVQPLDDPPVVQAKEAYWALEATRSLLPSVSVSDVDASRLDVELSVRDGVLSVDAASSNVFVKESEFFTAQGRAEGATLKLSAAPENVRKALQTLAYTSSKTLKTTQLDRQRIKVHAGSDAVVLAVETGATRGAVVSGNFTLALTCSDYLADALRVAAAQLCFGSTFENTFEKVCDRNATLALFGNETVEFTLEADAPGNGQEDASLLSFEAALQNALDSCAAVASSVAVDRGLDNTTSFLSAVRADVWRAPRKDVDYGFVYEVKLLNLPVHGRPFKALRVVRENDGTPTGLRAATRKDGNLTFEKGGGAKPFATVKTLKDGVLESGFSVEFTSQASVKMTTKRLALDSSAEDVEEALEALAAIVDVRVSRDYTSAAKFAWVVDFLPPFHVGPEPLLRLLTFGDATGAVEAVQRGAATHDTLIVKVFDTAFPDTVAQARAAIYTRRVVSAPRVTVRAAHAGVARGVEDEALHDFFRGFLLTVDEEETLAVLSVWSERGAASVVLSPAGNSTAVPKARGVVLCSEAAAALMLARLGERSNYACYEGGFNALQQSIEAARVEFPGDFSGVDTLTVRLDLPALQSAFGSASRTVSVAAVNDAPLFVSITAPRLVSQGGARTLVFEASLSSPLLFAVQDADGDALTVTIACSNGTLSLPPSARRRLSRGFSADAPNTLSATGPAAQWNAALMHLQYTRRPWTTADIITATVSDGALEAVVQIGVRAKCAQSFEWLLEEASAFATAPDAAALEKRAWDQHANVSLGGVGLAATCADGGLNGRLRVVFVPRPPDDADALLSTFGEVAWAGPRDSFAELSVDVEELPAGALALKARASDAETAALQISAAIAAFVVYRPPRDGYRGLIRIVAVVDSHASPRATELWLAVQPTDTPPRLQVHAGGLQLQALRRRDDETLDDAVLQARPLFGSTAKVSDDVGDEAALLTVDVSIAWNASTLSEIGVSVWLGCERCVLHFSDALGVDKGASIGAHARLRFLATAADASKALASLRVAAVADACWRASSKGANLALVVTDAAGQTVAQDFAIDVLPPLLAPLSVAVAEQALRSGAAANALFRGLSLRDGSGDCEPLEVIEVTASAAHGTFSISAEAGVDVLHEDASTVTLRGTRAAIEKLFNRPLKR